MLLAPGHAVRPNLFAILPAICPWLTLPLDEDLLKHKPPLLLYSLGLTES